MEGGALDNGAPAAQPTKVLRSKPLEYNSDRRYYETPMKKVYNQFIENWTPLMMGHEAPDFRAMRQALEFDQTTFEDEPTYAPMPETPPTGRGILHDDRETSHYVSEVLGKISPHLQSVYRGGAVNAHLAQQALGRDTRYSRSR